MTDTTLGYLLVGIGILFVLGLVFAGTTREGRTDRGELVHPPSGVHLPPPSWLPVLLALAAGVLGAGLVFTPWILIPGALVLIAGAVGWFRAAGREWRDVASGGGHDGGARHE